MKGVVAWGYPRVIQYHQFEYLTANSEEFLGCRIILQVDVAQEVRWCPETPRGCPKTKREATSSRFDVQKIGGLPFRSNYPPPDFWIRFFRSFPKKPAFCPSFCRGGFPAPSSYSASPKAFHGQVQPSSTKCDQGEGSWKFLEGGKWLYLKGTYPTVQTHFSLNHGLWEEGYFHQEPSKTI